MYYIIGDIHGQILKLKKMMELISRHITGDDTLIFLGDYIDRGSGSFDVIELLSGLPDIYNTCFLRGNHEDMFLNYYNTGSDLDLYLRNGGGATITSYVERVGEMKLPEKHCSFFSSLKLYYEGEDFIAVHAGLNPKAADPGSHDSEEILWIREKFFYADHKWNKTIIFGHTPTKLLHNSDTIYYDPRRNIIGLDTGAMYPESPLTCLRWPDKKIIRAF